MKTILAALAIISLNACAAIFGPDDWEPSGHMTVGGWLGPINLYRPNPNEKPRIVKVAVSDHQTRDVHVFAYKCLGTDGAAYSTGDAVYLCNRKGMEKHELAHAAGMKHTEWVDTGVAKCATVTASGYKTEYKVGSELCIANDYEMVSK